MSDFYQSETINPTIYTKLITLCATGRIHFFLFVCVQKKVQMFLTIYVFSILLVTGVCLQCEYCSSGTETCTGVAHVCKPSENACITLSVETTIGHDKWLATYKGCTKLKHCLPSPMSFTLPSQRRRKASMCCRKDLCNSGKVTLPKLGVIPNGLKCPGCFSEDPRCVPTEIISCNGWETNCIYYDVSVEHEGQIYHHAKRGCGTKNACTNEPRIYGVPGLYMEIVKSPQCTPAPKIIQSGKS
ncbi:phospholipase A2 inhibitor and Ly6/PLAUR domain-containing protein-like [Anolis sagrei]|uniref:phospholipase A2 inhibitor and Ly6/PLAUR domain-containing protein-like n=1 Tax=Anolis sagrei TaxID=38937 RepID=UPI00352116BE